MVLTKQQKKELKNQYLIRTMITEKPRLYSGDSDDLKEARRRLTYSLRNSCYSDIIPSKATKKLYIIADSSWGGYETEKERLASEMIYKRSNTRDLNIAKMYNLKHIQRDVNGRFFSFPEEVKYARQKGNLETIAKLKQKLPNAFVVLMN